MMHFDSQASTKWVPGMMLSLDYCKDESSLPNRSKSRNCLSASGYIITLLQHFKLFLLCSSLLLTGCASGLNQWTDQQLSPYLADELGRHPRFKNQPIQLVAMKGEKVQTEIDSLTADIRDRVFNQLLQSPGVNLVRSSVDDTFSPTAKLSDLDCYPKQNVDYYIGFDIKANAGEYQFSVKALDIGQGNWVSGFGKTWNGALSKEQRQALKSVHPDKFLSGSRRLPFTEQQSDLLASYMARRFSCLLKQLPEEYSSIFPAQDAPSSPFMQQLLQQIGHHISRFREISLSDSRQQASMLLKLQLHPVKPNLQQLWLVAEKVENGQRIAGLDTDAYVNFKASSLTPVMPSVPVTVSTVNQKPKPPAPLKTKTKPKYKPKSVQLFTTLQVIAPIGEPFCRTSNPWLMGDISVNIKQPLPYCFGFKIRTAKDIRLYILNSDPDGNYYRLNDAAGIPVLANNSVRYPKRDLYQLDPALAYETMHLIAISNVDINRKFKQLIATMPECCNSHPSSIPPDWEQLLRSFIETHQQSMEWRLLKLRPER